ncbi:MAG: hypothetical protein R3270_04450 [Gammaproteobacteria bacterium]|nr:hypothetical protein [Gammaproteobacteria bacterium]
MIAIMLGLAYLVALPAEGAEPTKRILACAEIDNDIARLQCFDDAVSAIRGEKPASEAQAQREFGAKGELKKELRPDEVEIDSIRASVDRIEMDGRVRIYHLDNGQAWEDVSRSRRLLLEEGDEVVIEKGFFDSYTLSPVSNNRSVKVRRIR